MSPEKDLQHDGMVDSHERPKRLHSWQAHQRAEELEETHEAALLSQMVRHLGGILSELKTPPINDVLATISGTIGAQGFSTYSWNQAYAYIAVFNYSAGELVVTGAEPSPSGSAPGPGAGVIYVPSGYSQGRALRSTALTLYGTAGNKFDFTAYIRPQNPFAGPCGQG